jgi:ubiquinone/menaquinone biosynthesis C-methylase UbiE
MVKNIFDRYADNYDTWFENNRHAYLTEVLALKKEIPNGTGIEIGVGSGRFASMLAIPYGIDISFRLTKIASDRGCDVAIADAENLPFRTGEFDYGLLMVTLCFVKNPHAVITEARRVLTEHGKLIIGIIDKNSHLGTLYRKKKSIFYLSAQFYSTQEVIAMLKSAGFHRIKTMQTLFENPEDMHAVDTITNGYGEGGFVVISGVT